MVDDDGFLRSIPKFLRRPEEPVPEDPIFMAAQDTAAPPPADIPAAIPVIPGDRPPSFFSNHYPAPPNFHADWARLIALLLWLAP